MTTRRRAWLSVIVMGCLSLCGSRLQAEESPEPTPIQFPITLFGTNGSLITPMNGALSPAEEQQFIEYAKRLERFPRYIYSGCHNRAHASYLLLPPALKAKVMKIWVIAPSAYSIGFSGNIGLKGNEPGYSAVSWGFHVALAYRDAKGALRVLDAALKPGEVLNETTWFKLLKIPPLTYWTLTDAEVYQFNSIPTDQDKKECPKDPKAEGTKAEGTKPVTMKVVNTKVWSGNYFRDFNGQSLNRQLFVEELARDAVGEDALTKNICPELAALTTKPEDLQNRLRGTPTPGCEPSFKRYESEKKRWMKVLYGTP